MCSTHILPAIDKRDERKLLSKVKIPVHNKQEMYSMQFEDVRSLML